MKECNQCGKCCLKFGGGGLSATPKEIEEWQDNHPDIFRYVSADGRIWVDPDSGNVLDSCPWLGRTVDGKRYTCAIYQNRPEDCRFYPSTLEEMIRDECEMIEPHDRVNSDRARKVLRQIMADSWKITE